MDIRTYLVNVAEKLTEGAPTLPPEGISPEIWQRERRKKFWHMLGIKRHMQHERPPLNVEVTRSHKRDGYRIDCLSYESLPGVRVEANLYVPDTPGPHPGLLYVCGHTRPQKSSHYQQHARRYAQLGFVVLIVDTVQYGEVRGYHHGTYRHGWFHWISRGYTPAGIETWNGIRGLDLLSTLAEVDGDRLGVTGTSGGGAMSWWIAAADERIKAASPSCGTATIASQVRERTLDANCDCLFPANLYGWSLIDMSALIAPRPLLIVSAEYDHIFTLESIRDYHDRLSRVYGDLHASDKIKLFTFEGPHSYSEVSRRTTFKWLLKNLKGQDVAYEDVRDIDDHVEEETTLHVYTGQLPAFNDSPMVHERFIPVASPPVIDTIEDLHKEKQRVIGQLNSTTFHAFPDPAPDSNVRVTQRWMFGESTKGYSFSFETDEGWRLGGLLHTRDGASDDAPTVVRLLHPEDDRRLASYAHLPGAPNGWRTAALAPRGTGDTVWSPASQWHVRRAAALTGRTIASMRVFDTLRGIRAIRSLPEVNSDQLYIMARGEMAVVALYAALLDQHIKGVFLYDPPATQNVPGKSDGTCECLEMQGVLQVTDLPYVAGMLWPTNLIFVGGRPESYGWTEQLYERLGHPGAWWNVSDLKFWRPNEGQDFPGSE